MTRTALTYQTVMVRRDDLHDYTIRPSNANERPKRNLQRVKPVRSLLRHSAIPKLLVVPHPEIAG